MKVAGDPKALLGDGKPGSFLTRPAKLTICPGGAPEGGRHGSHSEDGQRPGGDGRAVGAGDRETEATEHGTGPGHRHRRRQREDDAGNRDHIDEEHGERAWSTEGQRQYGKRGHQTQARADGAIATTLESRDRRQQRQVERDEGAEEDQDRNVTYRRVRRSTKSERGPIRKRRLSSWTTRSRARRLGNRPASSSSKPVTRSWCNITRRIGDARPVRAAAACRRQVVAKPVMTTIAVRSGAP